MALQPVIQIAGEAIVKSDIEVYVCRVVETQTKLQTSLILRTELLLFKSAF